MTTTATTESRETIERQTKLAESIFDEIIAETKVEATATEAKYSFGELAPWTEGDARIAVEEGEEFGGTLLLQDIVDADGEVLARVEYLPCGNDEENKRGPFVLDALNSIDSLREREAKLSEALRKNTVKLHGAAKTHNKWLRFDECAHADCMAARATLALVDTGEREGEG